MIHETALRREMRRILQEARSEFGKAKRLLRIADQARRRGEALAVLAFHSKLRGLPDRFTRFERAARSMLTLSEEAKVVARAALRGPTLRFDTGHEPASVVGWKTPKTGWRPGE